MSKNTPYILLLLVQLIFSGWHIIGSISLKEGADPLVFALYREIFGTILMYSLVYSRDVEVIIFKEDYARFLALGFFSFMNMVGTLLALQNISAARFALFQPGIPCIATLISIGIGLEKHTWLKLSGIGIAVVGAILIEAWDTGSSGDDHNVALGTVIVLLQILGMACLVVFQKPLLKKYDSTLVTFVYFTIGSIFTLLLCICWASRFHSGGDFYFSGLWLPWIGLAYAAILATWLNYNMISYASSFVPPSITTIYSTFQPVGTVLLSIMILGYGISVSEGIGGALVVVGLFVTVFARTEDENDEIENQEYMTHSLLKDYEYRSLSKEETEDERKEVANFIKNNIPFEQYLLGENLPDDVFPDDIESKNPLTSSLEIDDDHSIEKEISPLTGGSHDNNVKSQRNHHYSIPQIASLDNLQGDENNFEYIDDLSIIPAVSIEKDHGVVPDYSESDEK